MLGVFADAGLPVERRYAEGVIELTFPLPSEAGDGTADSYLTPWPSGSAARTWPACGTSSRPSRSR